jgi:hypothetical protein
MREGNKFINIPRLQAPPLGMFALFARQGHQSSNRPPVLCTRGTNMLVDAFLILFLRTHLLNHRLI